MINTKNKILIVLFIVITILSLGVGTLISSDFGYALTSNEFDKIPVLEDLMESTVDGKPFELSDYTSSVGLHSKPGLINFVEYCYNFNSNVTDNYALYLYYYNPKCLELDTVLGCNTVSIAVDYNDNGEPIKFSNYVLKFCSKSTGSYNNLFYKFRIVDSTYSILNRVKYNSDKRIYDISEFSLKTKDSTVTTAYTVGGHYEFSGYAKGFGMDKEVDTLNCVSKILETVKLDVRQTSFLTNINNLGADYRNEVSSVYFNLPNELLRNYGNLQKIRAEWYEYRTQPMFVTSDKDYALMFNMYVDKVSDASVPLFLYKNFLGRNSYGSGLNSYVCDEYDWCFNPAFDVSTHPTVPIKSDIISKFIPYVFYAGTSYSDGSGKLNNFINNIFNKEVTIDGVKSNMLNDYINRYSNSLGNGYYSVNGRNISKDLFLNNAGTDCNGKSRTMGYQEHNIDLKDTFDLISYDENHSWWEKLMDYGFYSPATDGSYKNVAPIEAINDLTYNASTDCEKLLINLEDYSNFREYYTKSKLSDSTTHIFRFANTIYNGFYVGSNSFKKNTQKGYIAEKNVFLGFDILDLTFNKNGAYHVIPAVSSPLDVVGNIKPPLDRENTITSGIKDAINNLFDKLKDGNGIPSWAKIIFAVLGLIIIVLLIIAIVKFIAKLVKKSVPKKKNKTYKKRGQK